MRFRSRIRLWVLLAIATAFGLSSTIQGLLLTRVFNEHPMLGHILILNTVYWYVPALLAPFIMGLAERFPVAPGRWRVSVPVHIVGALVYSVIHTGVLALTRFILMPSMPMAQRWMDIRVDYLRQLDWLFMTYLFLVGLAHALVFRKESERRSLDAAHLQTRLVEAQLQALQRQLQPHFLFNTLNAIAGLMRSDVEAADRMMDRLGDLLRMTLRTSDVQEVPLKDELELLQKYLDIEQTRFGKRLAVDIEIDPNALDGLVPNFLLQPLVENAVRHGIAPHSRQGHIGITALRDQDSLTIHIADSGDGVPPHRLTLMNQGVGLANTRARLERLYRDAHRFVFSNVEGGFQVTVSIPFTVAREVSQPLEAGAA